MKLHFYLEENGNEKDYDQEGNIIYELNKGYGKVVEYNDDGKNLFEGKIFQWKKMKKDKECNYSDDLIFESE